MKNTANKSITRIIGIIALFLVVHAGNAQEDEKRRGPHTPPTAEQLEKRMDKMAEELGLSDDQRTNILALQQAHFDEIQEDREENKTEREAMKAARDERRKQLEASISNELTEEQKVKFEEMIQKREEERQEKGPIVIR
jgi:Spy/CpxP family protein refolding chaperone